MGAFQQDMLYSEWMPTKSTGRWVVTTVCYVTVTNLQSIQKYQVIPGGVFTVCSSTNSGINSMELITPTAVPYILPLIQTEIIHAGLGKRQRKSNFVHFSLKI